MEKEILSPKLRRFAAAAYEARIPYMKWCAQPLREAMAACTEDERTLLQFFYGTMPLSDAAEAPFQTLLGFVRHGLYLRRTSPYCRSLPEAVFLKYVLYYRVNSERITDCRSYFYEQVRARIEGLPLREAALEINYWSAEHVSYQAADQRTLAPYYVYTSGSGRCGEESAFVVSVLRAAGIPARQVYAPRWAHCDDNHAWVEVLLEDGWHYLGACEPEEVFDKGWFDGAASRAVVIHAMNFTDYGEDEERAAGLGEERIGRENGVYYYNRTPAYAETAELTVTVREAGGASVYLELLNMAEFTPVANLRTDKNGKASLRVGSGTVRVRVQADDGREASLLVDTEKTRVVEIALPKRGGAAEAVPDAAGTSAEGLSDAVGMSSAETLSQAGGAEKSAAAEQSVVVSEYLLRAPREHVLHPAVQTREQRERNRRRLTECAERRKQWLADGAAAGRISAGKQLLPEQSLLRQALLSVLAPKDLRDAPEAALADALRAAQYEAAVPADIFAPYLLNQRIYFEELTPYRAALWAWMGAEARARLASHPQEALAYAVARTKDVPALDYRTIYATPLGASRSGYANPLSRRILAVAICRTLGVPARLEPTTLTAEYYDRAAGRFVPMRETEQKKTAASAFSAEAPVSAERGAARPMPMEETTPARLRLTGDAPQLQYGVQWTIARRSAGTNGAAEAALSAGAEPLDETVDFQTLRWEQSACEKAVQAGEAVALPAGAYRILVTARRPDGSQHLREYVFALRPGEEKELALRLPQISVEEMFIRTRIADIAVEEIRNAAQGGEVCGEGAAQGSLSDADTEGKYVCNERTTLFSLFGAHKGIAVYLEPGREPSEHVMNELRENAAQLRTLDAPRLVLLLQSRDELRQETLAATVRELPGLRVCVAEDFALAESIARRFYVNPEKLPLLLLFDKEHTGIYGCSGYNVGSVALALRLAQMARRNGEENGEEHGKADMDKK